MINTLFIAFPYNLYIQTYRLFTIQDRQTICIFLAFNFLLFLHVFSVVYWHINCIYIQ